MMALCIVPIETYNSTDLDLARDLSMTYPLEDDLNLYSLRSKFHAPVLMLADSMAISRMSLILDNNCGRMEYGRRYPYIYPTTS